MSLDADKGHDHCGVVAVVDVSGKSDVVPIAAAIARELEHRGQLGAGIAWLQDGHIRQYTDHGPASKVLSDERIARLGARGSAAIAHTRYATNTLFDLCMVQPYVYGRDVSPVGFALAFNGNLANDRKRRRRLEEDGHVLARDGDTEVLGYTLIEGMRNGARGRMADAFRELRKLDGAFNLVALTDTGEVHAMRDRNGFHPLVRAEQGSLRIIASEDAPIRHALPDAYDHASILPGHLLTVPNDFSRVRELEVLRPRNSVCFFEFVYFADHRSTIDGISVANVRHRCGKILAEMDADRGRDDIVVPVPDSAKIAARGYADARGLRQVDVILKNRDVGRTFIGPSQEERERKARQKYDIDRELLRGRRVVLMEDSMVRGTTMKALVAELFAKGAAEIHLRLASPPILSPCFYGIDFPTVSELLARKFFDGTLAEGDVLPDDVLAALAAEIGVGSIRYLPVSAIPRALGLPPEHACMACVTGKYPTPIGKKRAKKAEKSAKENIGPSS